MRLDPRGEVLTSSHIILARLVTDTREYEAAVPVFRNPIMYIPMQINPKPKYICHVDLPSYAWISASSGFSAKIKTIDILEYFYMAAVALIGANAWDDALIMLENAMCYPIRDFSVSKIMSECYKKWILVSLIHEGKTRPMPKSTCSAAIRVYHTTGKPYEAISHLFEHGTTASLRAEIEMGQQIWQTDGNTGIILQLCVEYDKWQIRNLGKTYSAISISDISVFATSAVSGNRFSTTDLENLITEMIRQGSLNATLVPPNVNTLNPTSPINPPSPILTFSSEHPILSEAEVQTNLMNAMSRIRQMGIALKRTDHLMAQHKTHIDHLHTIAKNKSSISSDQGMVIDTELDWAVPADDEDIMTPY